MQTLPTFVYLIPAVTFFSIGVVPGVFATIIFALPPGVRMTELGIRQVDSETVEAGEAFDERNLVVTAAYVDEGPTMKRFRPRAQGRAGRINKRTSHITVVVESQKEGAK